MSLRGRRFLRGDMEILASGLSFQDGREPFIAIGDLVRLNSGGALMLVVDVADGEVTAAWRGRAGIEEHTFPRICVHRARNAW